MTLKKTGNSEGINRRILHLTIPTVLSNISVPLLGLCDTAVAGHMENEKYLAAIAIGAVMMSMTYWLFGFLRGGTSGLTAVAYGTKDPEKMGQSLLRSSLLGLAIGIMLLAINVPVKHILLQAMGATPEVTELANAYFTICIWGSVPMMILMVLSGWFVGMQATDKAMWVNIGVSVLNVVFTLSFVYGLKMGFSGIPLGTLMAQWVIILPAAWLAHSLCKKNEIKLTIDHSLYDKAGEWKKLFSVNSNLFFRSACLIAATMTLYAVSARMGNVVTGANAVINQLFLFFSYFMDGLAYTGEALVGRYNGANDGRMMRLSVVNLLKWTMGVTIFFVVAYSVCLHLVVELLSDSLAVSQSVMSCKLWVLLIPIAGAAAFIYDGFYIGLTDTRPMLISTIFGVALFIVLIIFIQRTQWMLWMAFTCYLALRSLILIILFPYKKLTTANPTTPNTEKC